MNITLKVRKIWIFLSVLLFTILLAFTTVNAMTPIPPDLIDDFKADERYDDWLQQANKVKEQLRDEEQLKEQLRDRAVFVQK